MPKEKNVRKLRWVSSIVLFTLGIIIGVSSNHFGPKQASSRTDTTFPDSSSTHSNAPPWGNLEARKIPLEDFTDFFPDSGVRMRPARWFFENYSAGSLSNLFQNCALDYAQEQMLLDSSHWQVESNGILVTPPEHLVLTLSSPSRERIYTTLAASRRNYPQQYPFRFLPEDFSTRFVAEGLPSGAFDRFRGLFYTNRTTICFADVQALSPLLSSNEFVTAIVALYATPSYRLRLRVFSGEDVERVIRYWGRAGNERRIRPLLQSLSRLSEPQGTSINVSYLLPTFARLRLYTYPKAWSDPQRAKEDCFWTSMNFFDTEPDNRFLDPANVRQALHSDYSVIGDAPTYGDLVTLVGPSGDGRHMCVYLADNFVYTKNGRNDLAPWVIMKMDDMLAAFTAPDDQKVIIVRRKVSPGVPEVIARH